MGIYYRARRVALAAVCTCGAVAGITTATPGVALAKVACASPIYGSGSTLQSKQQKTWAGLVGAVKGLPECNAEKAEIKYNEPKETGSGAGLKEFGIPGKVLEPKLAGNEKEFLDGFVGTDDPPTATQLGEAEMASGAKAETIPIVAAPVALIFHLPSSCSPTGVATFKITSTVLEEIWGTVITWKSFLEKLGFTVAAGQCETNIVHEVRFDSSGTSFAFKQYLDQLEPAVWGGFVTDAPTWPTATAAQTEHEEGGNKVKNEGSGGVVKAVELTLGSIGYVNFANAKAGAFEAYKAAATKFWGQVQDGTATEFAQPGTTKGNCPAELTKAQEEALPKAAENPQNWEKFHLATPEPKTTGSYPLCTLTYDVAWSSYGTEKLITAYEKQFGAAAKTEEIKNTVKEYFVWATSSAAGHGQAATSIAEGYSPLATKVRERGAESASHI